MMTKHPSHGSTALVRGSLLGALVLLAESCDSTPAAYRDPPDLAEVRVQVAAAVWDFHAADTARNAEAVIALLWPEYEMLVDGQRTGYDAIAAGSREFMAGLETFHTVWSDLKVVPLSSDLAISSFVFRDSIVTKSGDVSLSQGPTSFVWERRNGEWRLRFGDADHYPLEVEGGALTRN